MSFAFSYTFIYYKTLVVNDNGTTYVDRYVDLGIYKGNWWTRTDSNNWNNYQRNDGDTDSITVKLKDMAIPLKR